MGIRLLPRVLLALGIALGGVALLAPPASAQATRTWVSGVGDDANPCSFTAPCKTWAGAISKTAAGGEIDALTDGGFGAVTITKAITINGGGHIASALTTVGNGDQHQRAGECPGGAPAASTWSAPTPPRAPARPTSA